MIGARYAAAVTLCSSIVLLSACATTVGGQGAPAALASGPTLAAALTSSLRQTTSLHAELSVSVAGQQVTGSADESFADGKLAAVDLTETLPSIGDMRIVIIGTQIYAKLPAGLSAANPNQPWVLADANSSDPIVRTLGTTVESVLSQSSLNTYSGLASAATSVKVDGSDSFDGTPATRYSIVVDINRLAADNPVRQLLLGAGLTTIPIDIWLDSQQRMIQFTEALTISGQATTTKVTISKYNQPVSISAPPADQIAH